MCAHTCVYVCNRIFRNYLSVCLSMEMGENVVFVVGMKGAGNWGSRKLLVGISEDRLQIQI